MPICSVNGKIGHGKGCVMTDLAIRQANKGRAVYSNWPIFDSRITYIDTWAEVCDLDNCDVFLDEMHLWFPSRDWQKLGKVDDLLRWSQARHDGLNIFWCSQNPSQVDIQIREVYTHWVYHVRRIAGPDSEGDPTRLERAVGAWAVINKFDASEFRLASKRVPVMKRWMRLNSMWGRFDTHHIIGFRDGSGVRAGRGALPSVRGKAPGSRTLTREEYEQGRYADAHHPGRVFWFPDVADAIRGREENQSGQVVSQSLRPDDRYSGDGRRLLASGAAHEDACLDVGGSHRPRLQFGKLKEDAGIVILPAKEGIPPDIRERQA